MIGKWVGWRLHVVWDGWRLEVIKCGRRDANIDCNREIPEGESNGSFNPRRKFGSRCVLVPSLWSLNRRSSPLFFLLLPL